MGLSTVGGAYRFAGEFVKGHKFGDETAKGVVQRSEGKALDA